MVRGYGTGNFANSRQRKKVMSELNRYKLTQTISTNLKMNTSNSHSGRFELKYPMTSMVHQLEKTKKTAIKSSNNRMIPNQNFYTYAGKKTMPIILSSIIGVPIPNSVSNAAYDSIIDSYRVYNENKNIDDALFVGMESFVNYYARNSAINYLQKHMQKKTDDEIFKDVLEGTILLSSLILEI